jgi:hypothetical protein
MPELPELPKPNRQSLANLDKIEAKTGEPQAASRRRSAGVLACIFPGFRRWIWDKIML